MTDEYRKIIQGIILLVLLTAVCVYVLNWVVFADVPGPLDLIEDVGRAWRGER